MNYARVIDGVVVELMRIDPEHAVANEDGYWTRDGNIWSHPTLGTFNAWDHNMAIANGYLGPTDLKIGDYYKGDK